MNFTVVGWPLQDENGWLYWHEENEAEVSCISTDTYKQISIYLFCVLYWLLLLKLSCKCLLFNRRMRATQEELEAVSGTSFAAETNCRDEDADMWVNRSTDFLSSFILSNRCLSVDL